MYIFPLYSDVRYNCVSWSISHSEVPSSAMQPLVLFIVYLVLTVVVGRQGMFKNSGQ